MNEFLIDLCARYSGDVSAEDPDDGALLCVPSPEAHPRAPVGCARAARARRRSRTGLLLRDLNLLFAH